MSYTHEGPIQYLIRRVEAFLLMSGECLILLGRVRVITRELVVAWEEKDLERVGELIEALARLTN